LPRGGPLGFLKNYWAYAIWALVQQFLLQAFFLSRFLRLLKNLRTAPVAAALIFALAHLPSPILTAVTLLWGLAACLIFLRYRNLYSLALAHAILGITISTTIPGPVDHNMRVGLSYLNYRPPPALSSPKP
jgi:membrane protease YdiL (CAAX protease family)